MNKHMRLVVSVLFIVIIILAVAITRFYSGTEKGGSGSGNAAAIEKKLDTDSSGNRIFLDASGLYGIIDSSERVIVPPEWQELKFTETEMCIASKQIRGRELFGCIDYDGNISIPMVYSSIDRIRLAGQTLYLARTSDKNLTVVYNGRFIPCFSTAWDSCTASDGDLILTSGPGTYTYSVTDGGMVFKHASVEGSTLNSTYKLDVSSRILLSELSPSMLEQMTQAAGQYLEYAYTGNSDVRSAIKADPSAVILTLFPEEHSITTKKLTGVSDIFVYSVRSEDKEPHYAVSVTADTALTYRNEANKTKRLRGRYKAVVEFVGGSAGKLRVISGKFISDKPDYPVPVPDTKPDDQQPSTESKSG